MTSYDKALPKFAALIASIIGQDELLDHAFLRDAVGRLTFVLLQPIEPRLREEIERGAIEFAPWIDPTAITATPEELFDASLANSDYALPEFIDTFEFKGFVRLIERRLVGQDWLRAPSPSIPGLPPIFVFASYKGGVGRSTALAISAAALSGKGLNILVIDLDLEAPGLGPMLLRDSPRFGTLDYFTESGVTDIPDSFYDDLIAASDLTKSGIIHVAPAVGRESAINPQNVLGKIARAYVEKLDDDGQTVSFLDRTRSMVVGLCDRYRYDAVFVDARAGLNEATAAAVLGLGAEILLFGVDTPQTFQGYHYLLAHLQRFRPSASTENDWRFNLRMVHAKAQANPKAQDKFRAHAFDLFSDTLYDIEDGIEEEAFNFDYNDTSGPHFAWVVLDDSNYAEFDPFEPNEQLSEHFYERTFGSFIALLAERIGGKL